MTRMTQQHERWTDFYNLLSAYVTKEGCDHSTKWSDRALRAMGLNGDEIVDSLSGFADLGGYCDCEILLNLAGGPGSDCSGVENGPKAEKFDLGQHQAFGHILSGISGFMGRLRLQLERTYGVPATGLGLTQHLIDEIRAQLSLLAQRERPGDENAAKAYYPTREPGESKAVRLTTADIEKCLFCGLGESSYRRGVSQALSRAGDLVRGGGTADDLDQLTDLSMDWRYDHSKGHGAYLDKLAQAWRAGERGVTGFDPRALANIGEAAETQEDQQ